MLLLVYVLHIIFFRADDQNRYTPRKRLTKRGTPRFVVREIFDVHVVAGINPTAQQDVCASAVHFSSYIHHHRIITAKRPTAYGASTLLSQTTNVRTGNISDLRTASVFFIHEEPHDIPCVLNGGGRLQVIRACPVTTDCIVLMS